MLDLSSRNDTPHGITSTRFIASERHFSNELTLMVSLRDDVHLMQHSIEHGFVRKRSWSDCASRSGNPFLMRTRNYRL